MMNTDTDRSGMLFQADPHFIGMDHFGIFIGIVEDRDDPLKMGRVKVRIFGIHPDDKSMLPTEDLPWAMPIMPITSASKNGSGSSPTGVQCGTIVIGFFADGMDRQIPMFFGVLAGGAGHNNAGGDGAQGQPDTSDPSAYNPESNPPNVDDIPKDRLPKGVAVAKYMLQNDSQLQPHHASAIVGNLLAESGLVTQREGPPYGISTPWPKGTVGLGYGWFQYTDGTKGSTYKGGVYTDFLNFCAQNKLDIFNESLPNIKQIRDKAQMMYLPAFFNKTRKTEYNKLKTNKPVVVKNNAAPYLNGTYDTSTIEGATRYVLCDIGRPARGKERLDVRVNYAKQILNNLQAGGNNGGTSGPIRSQQKTDALPSAKSNTAPTTPTNNAPRVELP